MTYSCALFEPGTETLEDAQRAKLELICRKLELEPGQRMLDIGCGWGSLAIHAAREHGASVWGITLSEPQAELASELAREAGVGDQVEFRVMDYRDLREERFDAIASIGMVEHVGEAQIDEYARRIARVLEPGGRVLNHGIVAVRPGGRRSHRGRVLEPLRVPRRRAAQPSRGCCSPSSGRASRRSTSGTCTPTMRDAASLDDPLRGAPRRGRAAGGQGAGARVAPLPAGRPQLLRNRPERGVPAPLQPAAHGGLRSAPTGARHEPARRRVPPERVPA